MNRPKPDVCFSLNKTKKSQWKWLFSPADKKKRRKKVNSREVQPTLGTSYLLRPNEAVRDAGVVEGMSRKHSVRGYIPGTRHVLGLIMALCTAARSRINRRSI